MGKYHPPVEHQFKPGQSGNPAGKPKGTLSLTSILRNLLNEPGDKDEKVTKAQELIKVMLSKALAGDARLMDMILNRIDGKVPDILVGGLGFGALEEMGEDALDKIIDAGEKAKGALDGTK